MNQSARTRIGVVGVGFMGNLHAQYYAAHSLVDLVGVMDVDRARAEQIAERYHCTAYTKNSELAKEIEAVSIVVPSLSHYEVALWYLSQGIHVLVEKPLAVKVEHGEKLVECAAKNNAKLLVGHQERFNSAVMAVADQLDEPKFIDAQRLGWYSERNTDVDVITDLMIHDIDLLLALMKSPVENVSAMGASVITSHVDIANARLEFANGAVANVTASRVSSQKFRTLEVYTGRQYLSLDLLAQNISITSSAPTQNGEDGTQLIVKPVEIPTRHTLETEINHFVETLVNGVEPLVSGEDGLSALRVAQMVREEIAQGQLQ